MLDVTLTPDDGDTISLHVDSRDVYRWEKCSRGKKSMVDLQQPSMTDMYELAHIACKRKAIFDGTLEEFIDAYAIDIDGEAPDVDPTEPEA
jgi:hypothetical protein